MSIDKAVDRIQKLRRLADSTNVNEAAIAAAEAQRRDLCDEHAAEREKLVDALTADVMGGLRVFVTRDGYALTEDQIRERANNIVCAIVGNYELRAL